MGIRSGQRITIDNSKLPLAHAIRGVAAFYVVIYHSKFILWSGGREFLNKFPTATWNILDYLNFSITLLFNSGTQMVMIFFVLSGFFISMSLDKSYSSFPKMLKTFYSIRAVRIYIPYLISIIWGVVVLYSVYLFFPEVYNLNIQREFNVRLIAAYHDLTFNNFLRSLLFFYKNEYIGFNIVYWSLLFEGIFYLIVPFIQSVKKQYFLFSSALFVCGMTVPSIQNSQNIFVLYLFQYNFYFVIGQVLYFYNNKIDVYLKSKNLKSSLAISSFLLFIIFDALTLLKFTFWANALSALTGGITLMLILNYEIKNNIFIKVVKYLGQISYSLYLVHVPLLILLYTIFYQLYGETIFYGYEYFVGILLSVPAGILLYKISEEPSLIIIRRIKKSLNQRKIEKDIISNPMASLKTQKSE